jgi:hypothetical protein
MAVPLYIELLAVFRGLISMSYARIFFMFRLSVLATIFIAGNSLACTCSFAPMSTQSIRAASNIFVFQLLSATVKRANENGTPSWGIEGKIKVVDSIYGARKPPQRVRFATGACCGARFDVGHYFVAFIPAGRANFELNHANALDIGEMYYPNSVLELDIRAKIDRIRSAGERLEDVFTQEEITRTEQIPPLSACHHAASK